mmetsp:Transcript_13018/g.19450  ORF Transcript_13018/g.19450 Transcript_13018/m.19450 type:complete len:942 (+) Transcript_13018:153-2978(+)
MAHFNNIILPQQGYAQAEGVWSRETAGDNGQNNVNEMSMDAAFKLTVDEGGIVEATFPFHGDPEGSQLSFQIGDTIKVLQKDELWSWGQLIKTGEEGYFPHNYVQGTFKPLPGMHELQMKMAIKRAREEAIENGLDPDAAELAIVREMNGEQEVEVQSQAQNFNEFPAQQVYDQNLNDQSNMFGQSQDTYSNNFGMYGNQNMDPSFMGGNMGMNMVNNNNDMAGMYGHDMQSQNQQQNTDFNQQGNWDYNNGGNYGQYQGTNNWNTNDNIGVDFGMWAEFVDGGDKPVLPKAAPAKQATSPTDSLNSEGKRKKKRQKLLRELVKSEESYVNILEAMMDTIISPCLGEGGRAVRFSPITQGEAQQMFSGLKTDEILKLNTNLRNHLRKRVKSLDDGTCVGDIFSNFTPALRTYADYCLHHETASSHMKILANSNDNFRSLLKRSTSDSRTEKRNPQELLALPKFRIPGYKASLEGILRYTDKGHADYPLLIKAIEDMSDIENFIEEGSHWKLNQARMADMKSKLIDPPHDLLKPGRILLRSGVLNKLGKYLDRSDLFVLFNDGLLQAKPQTFGNKYIYKRIVNVLRVELVGQLPGKTKGVYPFRIVTDGHIFLLTAHTSDQRSLWMQALTQVIKCGTRKLIHKGTLGLLRLEKDPLEVQEEYYYLFSDVVVRGKSLWRGKFKHMQTLDIIRIEETYVPTDHQFYSTGIPRDSSFGNGSLDLCFRLTHIEGSIVLMAPSIKEKSEWIKALYKQQEMKREDAVKGVGSSKSYAAQDISPIGSDSDDDSASRNTIRSAPTKTRPKSNNSPNDSARRSSFTEKAKNKGQSREIEVDLLGLSLEDEIVPTTAYSTQKASMGFNGGDLLSAPSFNTINGNQSNLLDMDLANVFATGAAQPAQSGGFQANGQYGNNGYNQQQYGQQMYNTQQQQQQQQPGYYYPSSQGW